MTTTELIIRLKRPFAEQKIVMSSPAPRKVLRAGRRFGKTTLASIVAVKGFLDGRRILYATPTQEQVDRFWVECKKALEEPIDAKIFYKNETRHIIELSGTEQRIRAKTAWNADTLRGDYADLLILDEYQLMKSDAWELVGAPMLLDTDGDAIFIYTQKRGKHHSKELFNKAGKDESGRWETFVFSSFDNPHLSETALSEISSDMTQMAYRAEILAEEVDDDPRALWEREIIDEYRTSELPEDLTRVVVGVDPQSTTGSTGIIVAALGVVKSENHVYIVSDATPPAGVSPERWGSAAVAAYSRHRADRIVGEVNHGGDMVENVIRNVEGGKDVSYKSVRASRGKAIRAEPVSALYQRGLVHHVGNYPDLEDELCNWVPGESKWSPNRLDALVWAVTELKPGVSRRLLMSDEEYT